MGFMSSKTLIQAHALFLFVLAVYLTWAPEAVTDSDIVFILGEALRIRADTAPTLARPQSPFAICGLLLVFDGVFDLIVATKIPQVNNIIARPSVNPSSAPSSSTTTPPSRINPLVLRAGTIYTEIWTLLAATRCCMFFAVSFFIYQSQPDAWGIDTGSAASMEGAGGWTGLDQLKNRVVFTYGFMEAMFWFWILLTLRDERQETMKRLAAAQNAAMEWID